MKQRMMHPHSHDEERRIRERALDETLAGTFPASDPPSSLPNPDDDSVDTDSVSNEPDDVAVVPRLPQTATLVTSSRDARSSLMHAAPSMLPAVSSRSARRETTTK